jgi:acetyl-CoA acyltransferase 1
MESMIRNYGSRAIPTVLWLELRNSLNKDIRDYILLMSITSENVATRYRISRDKQDVFAITSYIKASKAQRDSLFD